MKNIIKSLIVLVLLFNTVPVQVNAIDSRFGQSNGSSEETTTSNEKENMTVTYQVDFQDIHGNALHESALLKGNLGEHYDLRASLVIPEIDGFVIDEKHFDQVVTGTIEKELRIILIYNEHSDVTNIEQLEEELPSTEAEVKPSVTYSTHLSSLGWFEDSQWKKDGEISGSSEAGFQAEAIKLKLEDSDSLIEYRSHIQDIGWEKDYAKDGEVSGTTWKGKALEAVQIRLSGGLTQTYELFYRSFVSGYGWLSWASGDQVSGTIGLALPIEAIQVQLVKKGDAKPDTSGHPYLQKPTIVYESHVTNKGWLASVSDGNLSGTVGQALELQAIKAKIFSQNLTGGIEYRGHVENLGWQDYQTNYQMVGTTGHNLQLEAIQMRLTGELVDYFDLYYRSHVANIGWLSWAKNDSIAGSTGLGFSIEAVEIKLVPKGQAAPSDISRPHVNRPSLSFDVHVQDKGWLGLVGEGGVIGTTGQNKQVEAINAQISNGGLTGTIQYRTHIENIGWVNYVSAGQLSGTTGRNLQVEAVEMRLTGELAKYYDIYYQAHVQNFGWLDWAKNGDSAGSANFNYQMEALVVRLIRKGDPAPGATTTPFRNDAFKLKMTRVQDLLNRKYNSGNYGIYVKSVGNERVAGINMNTEFIAASTGKLPGIYYTQKLLNEGRLQMNNQWNYNGNVNSFKGVYSPWGAGILPKAPTYTNYSLQQALQYTIQYSDNVGANFLGYYACGGYNRAFLNEINRVTGRNWNNFVLMASARANGLLMESIYKIGGVANTYLQNTVFDDQRIPKYLPVRVGHKIGDVYDNRHDVAIVYTPIPYILSVMTKNNTSYETISVLSKEIYDIMK